MASIPTNLFSVTHLTLGEAAERLSISRLTARRWIRKGELSGSKIGRQFLVTTNSVQRILDQGSPVIRAKLFHAANERAMISFPSPELEAKEAADVARHRAAIAKAKLRRARENDLTALRPTDPQPTNTMGDALPEITDRTILKFAVTAGGISNLPIGRWNDDQIRELLRFARMAEGSIISSKNNHPDNNKESLP